MELLILCFALAYAIRGAVEEGASSGKAAAGRAVSAAGGRIQNGASAAKQRVQTSPSRAAGFLRGTGAVCGHAGRGASAGLTATGRGIRNAWRPFARGARNGWAKGRDLGRERIRPPGGTHTVTDPPHTPSSPTTGGGTAGTGPDPGPGARPTDPPPQPSGGHPPPDDPPERIRVPSERIYPDPPPEPPPPPRVTPTPYPTPIGVPSGGDGPAASHDPNQPEPTDTNQPHVIEGEIVTTAIGSGESTTYAQTCENAARFSQAAATHLENSAATAAEADALARANRQLAEDLAVEEMDAALEASAAAEAAEVYAEKMREAQVAADELGNHVGALGARLASHQGVSEAVKSLAGGAANRTGYYDE